MRGAVGVSPQFQKQKKIMEDHITLIAIIIPILYLLVNYFTLK